MGYYLNSAEPFTLYQKTVQSPYFVDKSAMIAELFPLLDRADNSLCITRPRRFGKSVMAQMIASFFSKERDSSAVFDSLKIAGHPDYQKYIHRYPVIYINFLNAANVSHSYDEFIAHIEKPLSRDLKRAYPEVEFWENASVVEDLILLFSETGEQFILVMDEWDCIFHKSYTTENDRKDFINFLSALTKDKGYLALTYMTGVLPIAKYSSGSSINHFDESHMAVSDAYSGFFGFTDTEVDELYERYRRNVRKPLVRREDLRTWYDGYQIGKENHLYNPRSIVAALTKNQTGSFWTQTGSFGELSAYIQADVDGVKIAVAQMIAGDSVPVQMQVYAASALRLDTRDRILSAMVIYGFLTYDEGTETVRIPNEELRSEFMNTIREEGQMGYINRLARASDEILQETLKGDADAVARALERVHDDTPILAYNNESELATVVYFAYLSALDTYEVKREEPAGRGYADFIFMPRDKKSDGIILELKKDKSPEEAIAQIRKKQYVNAFHGRLGEKSWAGKRILAVGIAYDSQSGSHLCRIEELDFSG